LKQLAKAEDVISQGDPFMPGEMEPCAGIAWAIEVLQAVS
jgi:hypothetical protein